MKCGQSLIAIESYMETTGTHKPWITLKPGIDRKVRRSRFRFCVHAFALCLLFSAATCSRALAEAARQRPKKRQSPSLNRRVCAPNSHEATREYKAKPRKLVAHL
jgi:hypothetical protein